MDDFLNKNKTLIDDNVLNDNRIYFTFRNEKRTSRTYIWNLEKFINDEKEINEVVKQLKKKLATSSICVKDEEGVRYGFQGDHKKILVKYLMEIIKIDPDMIKI